MRTGRPRDSEEEKARKEAKRALGKTRRYGKGEEPNKRKRRLKDK